MSTGFIAIEVQMHPITMRTFRPPLLDACIRKDLHVNIINSLSSFILNQFSTPESGNVPLGPKW